MSLVASWYRAVFVEFMEKEITVAADMFVALRVLSDVSVDSNY